MQTPNRLPRFDEHLPFLNEFILELTQAYGSGNLHSWDELDQRVKVFFTPEMLDLVEARSPGWNKMASYSGGITLTHVTGVFLGMFMLKEFQVLSPEQQQIMKWTILFHDIDKFHIRGIKDTMHAFHSAVITANNLPRLGFTTSNTYNEQIKAWSEFTYQAFIPTDIKESPKPDNQKLARILEGIGQLFGESSPAALITKIVLLHISVNADRNYPTPSPLTDEEIKQFIDADLFPLLRVMMLSDNEGWSMFEPETCQQQRRDTLDTFEEIQKLIIL